MYSDQASSAYPAVKTSSPRTEGYGSPGSGTELANPLQAPRQASDPRLRESSQHLETEHLD